MKKSTQMKSYIKSKENKREEILKNEKAKIKM